MKKAWQRRQPFDTIWSSHSARRRRWRQRLDAYMCKVEAQGHHIAQLEEQVARLTADHSGDEATAEVDRRLSLVRPHLQATCTGGGIAFQDLLLRNMSLHSSVPSELQQQANCCQLKTLQRGSTTMLHVLVLLWKLVVEAKDTSASSSKPHTIVDSSAQPSTQVSTMHDGLVHFSF